MADRIRAIQFGCGPIGSAVARLALERADFELVGAVDIDPAKAGRDLGEVIGAEVKTGVTVSTDADAVLAGAKADVVFHQTGSAFPAMHPQLVKLLGFGVNIVSTCEELSYPYRKEPELSADLDRVAKANGVTVVGTGVNPGFLMDFRPLALTAVCQQVKHVKVARIQDACIRRLPFQQKIGAGQTLEEFAKLVAAGTLKHVGSPESLAMIAAGLGWELDEITETIEPVVAKEKVESQYITVEPGQAAGVKQVAHGFRGGEELITLQFEAYLGAPESHDTVYITGMPNIEAVIKGGLHGDLATVAMTVNAARRVVQAPPGLLTMKDLPAVVCTAG